LEVEDGWDFDDPLEMDVGTASSQITPDELERDDEHGSKDPDQAEERA
jgi:hypothetical protein